jgi:hypothetical protein
MEIKGVDLQTDITIIRLTIENRVLAGYFCVDRNTSLILPDGTRLGLIKTEGIPFCPAMHSFKTIGEVLSFTLYFPPIQSGTTWFDMVEECNDNCFSVYGITLDTAMNSMIDRGYNLSELGKPKESATLFEEIIATVGSEKHGILGSLYSSTIIMHLRNGDEISAKRWYDALKNSTAPRLGLYLENLSARGIKW